jgi:hypothetical protein
MDEVRTWLTVMIVAVAGVALFKILAATKVGRAVPGLTELGAFL